MFTSLIAATTRALNDGDCKVEIFTFYQAVHIFRGQLGEGFMSRDERCENTFEKEHNIRIGA